jgi:hypothetical protein
MGKAVKLPKTKCCVSTTRCDRCPIRMLKEGTLPSGYGVHKRKLVKVEANGKKAGRKTGSKGKVKKSELVAAVRAQGKKKSGKKKLAA